MNKTLSDTISLFKFFLPILVIAIHVPGTLEGIPASNTELKLYEVFWRTILSIAVPIFFVMSGYLFEISKKSFAEKIKDRLKTIVIPYLIWNSIYVLSIYLYIFSGLSSPNNELAHISIFDVIWKRILGISTFPADGALWFIRNLFLVCCLYPVLSYILKKIPYLFLGILLVVNVLVPLLGSHSAVFFSCAFCYFPLGIFLAKKSDSFLNFVENVKWCHAILPAVVFLSGAIWSYYLIGDNAKSIMEASSEYFAFYVQRITTYFSIITFSIIAIALVKSGLVIKRDSILVDASFFVFAFHSLLIILFSKIFPKFQGVNYLAMMVIGCFLIYFISIFLYYILNKLFPKITSILAGKQ